MDRQTSRRGASPFWVTVLIGLFVVTLANMIPSPFVVQSPGPVIDVFGEIETDTGEVEVIRVEGAEGFDPSGTLSVLSVTISGNPDRPRNWLSLIRPLINPTQSIVSMSSVFPEGLTPAERSDRNMSLMGASQEAAIAAALHELGEPVKSTVTVAHVHEEGPSNGLLEAGDVIVSADGTSISSIELLRSTVAAHEPGEAVALEVLRGAEKRDVAVTPRVPEGGGEPLLGINVDAEFEFESEIALELDEIGGPSAGLVFALGVYESLTQEDLLGGLDVSGTGSINAAGSIGPIGGLQQKIWGASAAESDLMLMPLLNCEDLPSRLPDGLTIAPVATLEEAIGVLREARAGGTPAGVERCALG